MSDINNEVLHSVEDTNCKRRDYFARKKSLIVMLLLVYSAISGVVSCFLPAEDTPLDVIVSLPLLLLGIAWCFTDAAERNFRIGRFTQLLLILLFVSGLPMYLFQSRGIAGFKSLTLAILLIACICVCALVTEFVTLSIGEAAGLWEFSY